MPNVACAIFGCTNNTKKLLKWKKETCPKHNMMQGECGCPLPFKHFHFPHIPDDCERWVRLVNRQASATDKTCWRPNKSSVICSRHFSDGKPTHQNPYPTLYLGYDDMRTKQFTRHRAAKRSAALLSAANKPATSRYTISPKTSTLLLPDEMTTVEADSATDSADTQNNQCFSNILVTDKNLGSEISMLKTELNSLKGKHLAATMNLKAKMAQLKPFLQPVYKKLLTTDTKCLFYTGISNTAVFYSLCKFLNSTGAITKQKARVTVFYKNKTAQPKTTSVLCLKDRVLLTLMKLRLGSLHLDLADRFNISSKSVSTIFGVTIRQLSMALHPLIVFYSKQTIGRTMPKEYHSYKDLRCIIDCSELFIQKPSDLKLQASTWSDYKHHNTIKFLIAIAPQGCILYISALWGGRCSDRHIVKNSTFLSYLNPFDQVLADRGFTVREELLIRGAELVMPPANKGKTQMTSDEVKSTKTVANVRIHVERVIRRLKHFRILAQIIPISLLPYCDDILVVCAAITNLGGPIVKSWSTPVDEL